MVRHVFLHDSMVPAERQTGRREVDGLVEAIDAERTQPCKAFEVLDDGPGREGQCQQRGIGGDDQIFGQVALEAQARHAEGAVLVVHVGIEGVVARLGDAPGQALRRP